MHFIKFIDIGALEVIRIPNSPLSQLIYSANLHNFYILLQIREIYLHWGVKANNKQSQ